MKQGLLLLLIGFCLYKAWQDFGPKPALPPLYNEPYVAVYGRDAFAKEIRDARRAAGNKSGNQRKYNGAIGEMLDYAYGAGMLPQNQHSSRTGQKKNAIANLGC
ncbi:hypothetical protein [Shewanella sp. 6_MG-2023]|uniref:hypothetical protein n=1 Tax=Shewanella sp. 6_MG-2023 TaxID=3062660 RepID=UPI0026E37C80|nr:hypothetical protein [Shewanella sp. 6_MG-2023]MDO6621189.1 hypothetical protein [Shewanella sp. 6_MG-2023]